MKRLVAFVAFAALLSLGCARTSYVNLHNLPEPDHPPEFETPLPRGWQSYFLWGWVPTGRYFDAAEQCLGTEHVLRIETRRTFLQGLVAAFAGYYVNVYSPYNGRVICDHTKLPNPENYSPARVR